MSGFGQTGPYGKKGGFDIVAQGMSGIMMMTGYPGGRPAKVGIAMNDIASGVTALYGILGAYIGRLRSGKGQYLETSLLEAGLAWTHWESGAYFGSGELPEATGTRHRRSTPYQAYKTKDGYVTVGANNNKLWTAFCTQVCDKPEWLTDPRFATLPSRLKNIDELEREIEAVFATQPTAHWVEKLDAAGVPGGPVYTYDQILADPHIKARKMVVEIDHPKIGRMKSLGMPVKSTGELLAIRRPAPWLGQHSAEVLLSIGYEAREIESLYADGGAARAQTAGMEHKYRAATPVEEPNLTNRQTGRQGISGAALLAHRYFTASTRIRAMRRRPLELLRPRRDSRTPPSGVPSSMIPSSSHWSLPLRIVRLPLMRPSMPQ